MPAQFVEELNAEMPHGYTVDFVDTQAFVRIANREKALCQSLNSPGR